MTGKILVILKILMSVLVIAAGILEWMEFDEETSSLEIHHGVTMMGIVMLIDGGRKTLHLKRS